MIFTEEQKLFRQTVREFAEKELAPAVPEILKTNTYPAELYQRACDLGFLGVNTPEEYGGAGLGQIETCIVLEEIARVCPGFALSMEITLVTMNQVYGQGKIGEKMTPLLIEKGIGLGSGATPPEGQPNGTEHTTMFTKTDGGYLINGVRLYGTNHDSEWYEPIGLDENREVLCAFIRTDAPGVTVSPFDEKLGQAGNRGGTVTFKDVFVSDDLVEGNGNLGANTTYYTVYNGCAAEGLGCVKGLFEKTLDFCKNRTHAGKPLTQQTAVSYKIAELKSKIYCAESMVYDCAEHQAEYERTQDPELMHEWFELAESTKMRAPEMLIDVAYECMKLFGGMGYHDPMIWHYMGDALNYCMMDQTTEIHLGALAALMGL